MCCDGVCDDDRKQNKAKSNATNKDEVSTMMAGEDPWAGKVGVTCTPLTPYGMVVIDGGEHPAKSQSNLIEEGQQVIVIGKESFGLLVRLHEASADFGADKEPKST